MRTWKVASALLAAGWLLSPLNFATTGTSETRGGDLGNDPGGHAEALCHRLGIWSHGRRPGSRPECRRWSILALSACLSGAGLCPRGKGRALHIDHLSQRLSRGKRTDVLETYDTSTLSAKGEEIRLADTRAMAVNYRPMMHGSADGRWMFVQNASPATSISVVDMKKGSQTGEIQNAGCYGIYPVAGNSLKFATMCGDGTFGLYVMNEDGTAARRKAPRRFSTPIRMRSSSMVIARAMTGCSSHSKGICTV